MFNTSNSNPAISLERIEMGRYQKKKKNNIFFPLKLNSENINKICKLNYLQHSFN